MMTLTAREREICELLAYGLSNLDIANRLGIAERTVKARLNIMFLRNRIDPTKHKRIVLALRFVQEMKLQAASA